jgi:hypothetical protein
MCQLIMRKVERKIASTEGMIASTTSDDPRSDTEHPEVGRDQASE